MIAHCTSHWSLSQSFVQSAPISQAPVQAFGVPEQLEVHSEPAWQVKLQLAPSLQAISQVDPRGQVNLQLLFDSHVSLQVRRTAQSKSQLWPALQVHELPQLPFVGPVAASVPVVPEEEDDDDVPVLPSGVPELEAPEDDAVPEGIPPSPSAPAFQL